MPPLTHAQIWTALDRLAVRAGLSPSGLAKRAGLDPTTFNKSKRITPDGRAHWPSTESLAKSLEAAGTTLGEFIALIGDDVHVARGIPLTALALAGTGGHLGDTGFPVGGGWDEVAFALDDAHAYALEITGDKMQPAYRNGTIIVISPAAPIRRGDRVVIGTRGREVMAMELRRKSVRQVELKSLGSEQPDRVLPTADMLWIWRIIWASQ